jgi:hypothetical protein
MSRRAPPAGPDLERLVERYAASVWFDGLMPVLLRYTRWRSSRVAGDSVYVARVRPDRIGHVKLIDPKRLPVTGEDAVFGAVDGPWDRFKRPFRDHHTYRSIRARVVEGRDWEETPIHGRNPREKAKRRAHEIDELIDSIRREGYRAQDELGDDAPRKRRVIGDLELPDEVIVGMDRRGRLFHLRGGRHRLAIAQLLDVDEIPVILSLYHPKATEELPTTARRVG